MVTIALYNLKGGVGKTSLVFHLSWMFRQLGHTVLAVDITNIGGRLGTEIVQVYLEAPADDALDRPVRWLAGFAAVQSAPGDQVTATVTIASGPEGALRGRPESGEHGAVIRAFDHQDFDAARLVEAKAGRTVSVCLPAHNESSTVAAIVRIIREQLVERHALVDELLVIDDHSSDDTASVAIAAGARVVSAADVLTTYPNGPGKGRALWKSVHASTGDIVMWCDADVTNFSTAFVVGVLGPLLTAPDVSYAKGYYRRPLGTGA